MADPEPQTEPVSVPYAEAMPFTPSDWLNAEQNDWLEATQPAAELTLEHRFLDSRVIVVVRL